MRVNTFIAVGVVFAVVGLLGLTYIATRTYIYIYIHIRYDHMKMTTNTTYEYIHIKYLQTHKILTWAPGPGPLLEWAHVYVVMYY